MPRRERPLTSARSPAVMYQYPEHLRHLLAEIPSLPGVYLFHGDSETFPLYIGKSINLRSRILSHFRSSDEAKLLHQTKNITFIRTAGEIGALLLEAKLIKEQQPLFNKRLRRNRELCSLMLTSGKPQIVYAKDVSFAHQAGLYGLFANAYAAKQTLLKIADEQRLCHGLLGLEPHTPGKACFRAALNRCAGACCGRESVAAHQERLLDSLAQLKIICWPWLGAVALVESNNGMTEYHVINNWLWLGTTDNLDSARALNNIQAGFDQDGYKILCKPLLSGVNRIIDLSDE